MFKKIIAVLLACFCLSSTAVFAAKSAPIEADNESWVWYEFKAKVLGRNYKFFAYKTDEQLKNRGAQNLNKNGWGVGPQESVEQFFALHRFEKAVIFDELKAVMKENGYKWAFTTYKNTTKDETTIHLITFWYDAENDIILSQVWSK